jgi:mannan endo-1,4-beta-mannosidase
MSTKTFTIAITNASSMSGNANFNVNLSAPGGGAALGPNATATVTITPVAQTGGSGGNAAKVLSYLGGLNSGSSRRVLSGQHADIWTSDLNSTTQPMDNVNPLVSQTGDSPAILALVLNYATNSYAYNVPVTNTLAAQQWAKGGMVMLSIYSNDPTFSSNASGQPNGQSIPSSAFHSVATKGSAAYVQWHKQLDTYAAALHTLTDSGNVLILRPFIEINGNWNWYGGESATDFIAIWKDMHDYLTITKGVKGLLWLYNVNQDVGGYMSYYPGSAYVDIVGMDLYRADPVNAANSGNMYAQLVASGKPLIIPEIGLSANGPSNFTQDDMVIINSIRNSLPNVVGFVAFNGSWSIVNQNNASSLMNDPWIINVSNIPAGL